ncbi:hypothetical protein SGLAM104S_09352 [Streptomyces glaucescens]
MDGSASQAAAVAAEVGAMIRFGRARVLPSTVTVSETVFVVVLVRPSWRVLETCQVVASAAGLVKVVTTPSGSDRVKEPVVLPFRVRSSAPGSPTQAVFAALAVKWIASPSSITTSTAVSETLRMWL